MYYKLAPSILVADSTRLGEQVKEIYGVGVEHLHLDMTDRAFIPSISFGTSAAKSLHPHTRAIFDVRIIAEEPGRYVEGMKDYGADIITVQAETYTHLDRAMNQIKEAELKVGVASNLAAPVCSLECILGRLDMVLIMAVNPGFGEQRFILYVLDKVHKLKSMLNERRLKADIRVDGGMNMGNVREIIEVRASVFVAGSAVSGRSSSVRTREFAGILKEYEK